MSGYKTVRMPPGKINSNVKRKSANFDGTTISEEFRFNSNVESKQKIRVPASASVYLCRNLSKGIFLSTTTKLA